MKHKKHMKRCLILFTKEMQFTNMLDKNLQNHFTHIRGSTYKSWQSPDYQVSGWTVLLSCWLVSVWNDIFPKQTRQFPRIHHNYNTLILWLSHPTSGNLSYRDTYKHDKPRHCIKKQRHYFGNNVHIVKAMVFPVVKYGCESWTIKIAEHWRINCGVGEDSWRVP